MQKWLICWPILFSLTSSLAAEVIVRRADSDKYAERQAPTQAQHKRDDLTNRLILPFFFVNPNGGETTLYAVRNVTDEEVPVAIQYFGTRSDDGAQRTDTVTLQPRETFTVNLRDLTGLTPQPDGTFRGFARVLATGGPENPLAGDYFLVDLVNNFATGDRLLALADFCQLLEIRFLSGGAFDGGTVFRVGINEPQGIGDGAPPTAIIRFTNEAGDVSETVEIFTDENVLDLTAGDLTSIGFGVADFDFSQTIGSVLADFSASGKFSIGMNAVCKN